VQVHDVEYYFGNGICKSQPYSYVGRLVLSKKVGITELTQDEIETKILFNMYDTFTRKDCKRIDLLFFVRNENLIYSIDDLLRHNCNHFTNTFLHRLLDIHLPMRFNRTERCIIATPCCTRTLNCIFGNDWTRPIIGLKTNSNEQQRSFALY
jgi:hypothetical protein